MTSVSTQTGTPLRVDLSKIEGDGDFPCPKCNTLISPDDLTGKVYTILSIEGNQDNPVSMILQCNNCKSIILLDGFSTV
jgi:hypothetical protein